jgi:biotin carboxyl carrier protein
MAEYVEPFQINFVDGRSVEVTKEQAAALDLVALPDGSFHVLHEGKKYKAEIISSDTNARTLEMRINGSVFKLHIADKYERLITKMGLSVGKNTKLNEIKAPMPGLVLSILVVPGQVVQKGDALLILEAMKMENVLKSPGDGVVKKIVVEKSTPVDKGALLIVFE